MMAAVVSGRGDTVEEAAVTVLVGTSGYNYPEWRGSFYPAGFAASKMLGYYAERFSTVEINYTFYRMPTAKTITGWDTGTPSAFCFALKASRRITHDRRLKDVDEPLRYFLDTARRLGAKLGPILFQLPPNFKKDLSRLGDLLVQLPADLRYAFEFRHPSWFAEDVYGLLRGKNAALCIADTGDGTTPVVATGDFGYLRLRDEGYSDVELREWSETVKRLGSSEWRDAFVYFKHEESGAGPAFAERFGALLSGRSRTENDRPPPP
ncbi:MAG TPA: DUF72 domain-containing protein [Methylomirabilota bacterium]|jgi:uncharacterized protein YecE (DUF72 family)|nr:DUF72 domain-containing protein [Methylomirabilota bacterium]